RHGRSGPIVSRRPSNRSASPRASAPVGHTFAAPSVLFYRDANPRGQKEVEVSDRYTATYINFQGRAREALELYHGILGGKLTLYAFDGSGALKAAGPTDPIGYARLQAEGVRLYGSDGNPAHPATPGDNIAITLAGPDKDGMMKAFDALAVGG